MLRSDLHHGTFRALLLEICCSSYRSCIFTVQSIYTDPRSIQHHRTTRTRAQQTTDKSESTAGRSNKTNRGGQQARQHFNESHCRCYHVLPPGHLRRISFRNAYIQLERDCGQRCDQPSYLGLLGSDDTFDIDHVRVLPALGPLNEQTSISFYGEFADFDCVKELAHNVEGFSRSS